VGGAHLLLQEIDGAFVRAHARQHELERHLLLELLVLRQPHLPHPARAKLLLEQVVVKDPQALSGRVEAGLVGVKTLRLVGRRLGVHGVQKENCY